MRLMILMTGLLLATPDPAQEPRLYENSQPVQLQAAGDTDASAQTDPLGQVDEVAMKVRFDCATPGCDWSFFQMQALPEDGEGATATFTATPEALKGGVTKGDRDIDAKPFDAPLKPGETFDLRMHWTTGHRVSFDIYRTDPVSGASSMESQDVQLDGNVERVAMKASHGTLTILSQTYSFK